MEWIADTLKLPLQDVIDYTDAIGSKDQKYDSQKLPYGAVG